MMALAATVKINNRRPRERVLIPFLDVPPTAKHPVRGHQNRVLREKRCQDDGIVLVNCRVKPQTKLTELTKCLGIPEEIPLLDCLWIGGVLLLGEDRRRKADRQPY
jgi:hypothetical protein